MKTKESERIRAREYRVRRREEINQRGRERWRTKKRYLRRKKKLGEAKCAFCRILLASTFVGMKRRKYCNECINNPDIRRIIRSLYIKRWYHKKHGLPTVVISFPAYTEDYENRVQKEYGGTVLDIQEVRGT